MSSESSSSRTFLRRLNVVISSSCVIVLLLLLLHTPSPVVADEAAPPTREPTVVDRGSKANSRGGNQNNNDADAGTIHPKDVFHFDVPTGHTVPTPHDDNYEREKREFEEFAYGTGEQVELPPEILAAFNADTEQLPYAPLVLKHRDDVVNIRTNPYAFIVLVTSTSGCGGCDEIVPRWSEIVEKYHQTFHLAIADITHLDSRLFVAGTANTARTPVPFVRIYFGVDQFVDVAIGEVEAAIEGHRQYFHPDVVTGKLKRLAPLRDDVVEALAREEEATMNAEL